MATSWTTRTQPSASTYNDRTKPTTVYTKAQATGLWSSDTHPWKSDFYPWQTPGGITTNWTDRTKP